MSDVVWRNEALDQLEAVIAHMRQFDPAAAERIARRLRELASVSPYVLTYEVDSEVVTILDIRHDAMLPRAP